MLKYTPSKNALIIAKQYLKQEFRKIFSDIKDEKIYKRIDKSIDSFNFREGEMSFWNLLAAIAEGWKLKQVFFILSDDKFQWKLKDIPLEKIVGKDSVRWEEMPKNSKKIADRYFSQYKITKNNIL